MVSYGTIAASNRTIGRSEILYLLVCGVHSDSSFAINIHTQ